MANRIDLQEGVRDKDRDGKGRYHPYVNPDGQRPGEGVAATTGEGNQVDITDVGDGRLVPTSQVDETEMTTEGLIQQLIDLAKSTDKRNQEAIEEFIGTSIPKLEALAAAATVGDAGALAKLKEAYANFEEMAPPEMVAAAQTDPEDVQRQHDAYAMQGDAAKRFKELSDPTLTAEERYMMEVARLEEEGSRKAANEAALRDLDARGARSGGAEMAAMLGNSQITSQNRALSDLGAQANAQQRAMLALQGYGNTSAQMANTAQGIRDSGDVMSRFNQQQAQQWAQWEGDFKAGQQRDATDRSKDLFDAGTYVTKEAYGRGKDIYGAERDATAMKTGQYSQGAQALTDAISGAIGQKSADQAAAALEEDDSFNLLKPKSWGIF